MTDRHIVLGKGGAIAEATLAALRTGGLDAHAIGRQEADARDAQALGPHLDGASHVYLCVGLPYEGALWERNWPKVISATLDACETAGARLVFFDNVLCKIWTSEPDRFIVDPFLQMPRLNT